MPAVVDLAQTTSVEASRRALLEEIGAAPHLTFVRGPGNLGDELIWAGTRALLDGHVYHEIGIDELGRSEGELALIAGGGAWSRRYHEYMPAALAVAEQRFERVIVLPSSFEVAEDEVRAALQRSRATVFAREADSYRAIAGLCRARLAHDCAFFFPYPQAGPGDGTLEVFRTDLEREPGADLPPGNQDISATLTRLDDWLQAIGRHARVRTDRAHVMIAAALMGRAVEYRSCSYFKVDALAATLPPGSALRRIAPGGRRGGHGSRVAPPPEPPHAPVRAQLAAAARSLPAAAALATTPGGGPRVCAIVLSRDRPEHVVASVRSVLASGPGVRVLVLDANSGPEARAALQRLADAEPAVELRLGDRNLGAAGGRRLGAELAQEELVLLLDDDAELMPGALARLVCDLDAHPGAMAVTALVVGPDGRVFHFGGWPEVGGGVARFPLEGNGLPFDDPRLPPTGPCGWVPGTTALVRRQVLADVPIDPGMGAYYEDNDWCLRVARRHPEAFRRCREALSLHHLAGKRTWEPEFVRRAHAVGRLAAHAHFLRVHGVLLQMDLGVLVPELACPDGSQDLAATRLLLELVDARGVDWTLARWTAGDLAPLFDTGRAQALAAAERLEAERDVWRRRAQTLEEERDALVDRVVAAAGAHEQLSGELAGAAQEHGRLLEALEAAARDRGRLSERLAGTAREREEHAEQLAQAARERQQLIQSGAGAEERAARAEALAAGQEGRLAWLAQRSEALALVEAGGWWRLRDRLQPVLRLASRARGRL